MEFHEPILIYQTIFYYTDLSHNALLSKHNFDCYSFAYV